MKKLTSIAFALVCMLFCAHAASATQATLTVGDAVDLSACTTYTSAEVAFIVYNGGGVDVWFWDTSTPAPFDLLPAYGVGKNCVVSRSATHVTLTQGCSPLDGCLFP